MKKMVGIFSFILLMSFVFNSCQTKVSVETGENSRNEHLVMSVLYLQKAAEARALYYQAYNLAREKLRQILAKTPNPEKLAVVLDIDETVLNNTPYEAKLILTDKSYPTFWEAWCNMAQAKAIPGAREFLRFADRAGVNIFYVSNRDEYLMKGTLRNLKKVGFPQVNEEHILLRKKISSKEPRRKKISKSFDIALLIGDNLNDFSNVFEKLSVEKRFSKVDSLKDYFGNKFIILPNPMYGAWEAALYNYNWNIPEKQRAKIRHESLEAF